MIKIFKVVFNSENRLFSALAEGELRTEYGQGMKSIPPHSCLPLLAFSNRDSAMDFIQNESSCHYSFKHGRIQLWEAEAEISKIDFYFVSYSMSISHILSIMQRRDISNRQLFPTGTVFCDSITLTQISKGENQ